MTEIQKVLLTGATGFVGSHVARKLVREGYSVVALKRKTSDTSRIADILSEVTLYDLEDVAFEELLADEGIDAVVHLATKYQKQHHTEDLNEMFRTNIEFPARLLEAMRRSNVKYFINTGTFFEYQQTEESTDESAPILPFNLYTATKQAFLSILAHYSQEQEMRAVDLKLFTPYGPDDHQKLVPVVIEHLKKHLPLSVSPGEQTLSWTYVEDIAEAYAKALEWLPSAEDPLTTINIGSEKAHTVREVVDLLRQLHGGPDRITFDRPYSEKEYWQSRCDPGKAATLLNWKASTSLEEGLQRTLRAYHHDKR